MTTSITDSNASASATRSRGRRILRYLDHPCQRPARDNGTVTRPRQFPVKFKINSTRDGTTHAASLRLLACLPQAPRLQHRGIWDYVSGLGNYRFRDVTLDCDVRKGEKIPGALIKNSCQYSRPRRAFSLPPLHGRRAPAAVTCR